MWRQHEPSEWASGWQWWDSSEGWWVGPGNWWTDASRQNTSSSHSQRRTFGEAHSKAPMPAPQFITKDLADKINQCRPTCFDKWKVSSLLYNQMDSDEILKLFYFSKQMQTVLS